MCTLVYSANSHRKIIHFSHCKIIQRIPKSSRRTFDSLETAQEHGYRLCKCCPSIARKYRKERKQVDDFCKDNGFTFKLLDGKIHVISKHDCWQIIVNGNNKSLFLYHKNTYKRYYKETLPSIIPGFHSQSFRSKTILGYLEYIASHDKYRDEHPCTENSSSSMVKTRNMPEWAKDKYGRDYINPSPSYRKIKGTKRYRKEQAKKKQQERRASIIRVNALLEELTVIGCGLLLGHEVKTDLAVPLLIWTNA